MRFEDLSIKKKLILLPLLVAFTVLALSTLFNILNAARASRAAIRTKLVSMADMLGHSCQSALFFRDPAEAARTLKSLAAEPDVVRAWILDGDGGVFAEYGKPAPGESPPSGTGESEIKQGRTLSLSRRIVADGEGVGAVVLRYDLSRYRTDMLRTHLTSLLALAIGLAVALLLALLVQRTLSTPILRLVEVLGHVSRTSDLSIRLPDPRRDEIGVLYRGFNAMLTMISNREKDRDTAEAALRESESKYRTLVENAKDGIVILQDSRFVYANPSLVDMSESPLEELLGTPFLHHVAEEEREKLAYYYESRLRGVVSTSMYETVFVTKTGRHIHAEVNAAVIPFHGRPADLVIIRNINERKKIEAEIRALNESLERRVQERTRELAAANERLIELDQLKSLFLASMSHELRTPLNSILGFTGLLLMGLSGPLGEEQTRQLSMVENSAKHLLELINEVLDISKIESGRVDLDIESFAVAELAEEAIKVVTPLAQAKGLALATSVPEGLRLESDRRRVKQVLMNLLGNAVKFSDKGTVRLDVEACPGRLSIRVADQGIGIHTEDLNKLFNPFGQIDMSSTKRFEGTGLGLYLSKKILAMLGGTIAAESEYGHGSVFTFRLPLLWKEKPNEDGAHH
jgi:PAS domain S-box-containing protein